MAGRAAGEADGSGVLEKEGAADDSISELDQADEEGERVEVLGRGPRVLVDEEEEVVGTASSACVVVGVISCVVVG